MEAPTGNPSGGNPPRSISDLFIAQHDRDSTIVILWSGEGVRASFLHGRTLAIGGDDIRVSATTGTVHAPAAMFRDSTLYVLWQEDKRGVPEIFGHTSIMSGDILPRDTTRQSDGDTTGDPGTGNPGSPRHDDRRDDSTSTPSDSIAQRPGARLHVTGLAPLPAHTYVRLGIELPSAGALHISLVDALGRCVQTSRTRELPAGHSEWDIVVDALPPGVYIVVVRDMHGGMTSDRLLLLR
jgi:hypothetical protein